MDSIEHYLEQADFYRAVARKSRDFGTRVCFEYVARSYEVLAESQKQSEQLARAEEALRQLYVPLQVGLAITPPPASGKRLQADR